MNLRQKILLATDRVLGTALVRAGARQRGLFRRRGLVVSPGGGIHGLPAGWNHAGETLGYGSECRS